MGSFMGTHCAEVCVPYLLIDTNLCADYILTKMFIRTSLPGGFSDMKKTRKTMQYMNGSISPMGGYEAR